MYSKVCAAASANGHGDADSNEFITVNRRTRTTSSRLLATNPQCQIIAKKLFVGNVNPPVSEKDFVEFYQNFGTLTDIFLAEEPSGKKKNYGFVEFRDPMSLQNALDALPHIVKGVTLAPELPLSDESIADLRKVFGNKAKKIQNKMCRLSAWDDYKTSRTLVEIDESIRKWLTYEDLQCINSVRTYLHNTKGQRCHQNKPMFVKGPEDLRENNGVTIKQQIKNTLENIFGDPICVSASPNGVVFKKLFVGNLAKNITLVAFRDFYSKFGSLADAFIAINAKGVSRQFGFVEFEDTNAVQRAILALPHVISGVKVCPQILLSEEGQVKLKQAYGKKAARPIHFQLCCPDSVGKYKNILMRQKPVQDYVKLRDCLTPVDMACLESLWNFMKNHKDQHVTAEPTRGTAPAVGMPKKTCDENITQSDHAEAQDQRKDQRTENFTTEKNYDHGSGSKRTRRGGRSRRARHRPRPRNANTQCYRGSRGENVPTRSQSEASSTDPQVYQEAKATNVPKEPANSVELEPVVTTNTGSRSAKPAVSEWSDGYWEACDPWHNADDGDFDDYDYYDEEADGSDSFKNTDEEDCDTMLLVGDIHPTVSRTQVRMFYAEFDCIDVFGITDADSGFQNYLLVRFGSVAGFYRALNGLPHCIAGTLVDPQIPLSNQSLNSLEIAFEEMTHEVQRSLCSLHVLLGANSGETAPVALDSVAMYIEPDDFDRIRRIREHIFEYIPFCDKYEMRAFQHSSFEENPYDYESTGPRYILQRLPDASCNSESYESSSCSVDALSDTVKAYLPMIFPTLPAHHLSSAALIGARSSHPEYSAQEVSTWPPGFVPDPAALPLAHRHPTTTSAAAAAASSFVEHDGTRQSHRYDIGNLRQRHLLSSLNRGTHKFGSRDDGPK